MTEDSARRRAVEMMARQNTAYAGPVGTWVERWIPGLCKHETVRCTHGDEIIHRNWRRRVCMICGRALRGPLPRFCWFTGRDHSSSSDDSSDDSSDEF